MGWVGELAVWMCVREPLGWDDRLRMIASGRLSGMSSGKDGRRGCRRLACACASEISV